MPQIVDVLQRPLRDLRISVTDRCNFRCVYCMPKEIFGAHFAFLPHDQVLTFEEIARLGRLFVAHGVEKIRLTGGEPLIRRDIDQLVGRLADIPGLRDLTLTTNGALLKQKARALKDAGLKRITVSLDSLKDETFMAMNDVHFPVRGVLDGIEAAAAVGMQPIKINMVVKRGVNDQDVLEMARFFKGTGCILRFIEYMDVGATNGWQLTDVLPAADIFTMIDHDMPLERMDANYPGEVAMRYRYRDGTGEIGIIASVTTPFCHDCTRARLTAEGKLYTCLFSNLGHDLRARMRQGSSDDAIADFLRQIWRLRDDRYSELRTEETAARPRVEMSHIGG